MKYKFEIARRAAKTQKTKDFAHLIYLLLRSKFGSQNRYVFGLAVSADQDTSIIEIPGYRIEPLTIIEAQNPSIIKELTQNTEHLEINIENILKNDGVIWIGYLNDSPATFAVTKTGDKKPSYFFPLTPECVVISHCVTFTGFRGKGLYPVSLSHIVGNLAKTGVNRFFIDCAVWNMPSYHGIEHVGFQLIGQGTANKNGKLTWHQKSRPDFAIATMTTD